MGVSDLDSANSEILRFFQNCFPFAFSGNDFSALDNFGLCLYNISVKNSEFTIFHLQKYRRTFYGNRIDS